MGARECKNRLRGRLCKRVNAPRETPNGTANKQEIVTKTQTVFTV